MCANAGKLEVITLEGEEDEACKTFVIKGEDHTLGNALRYIIMKNPDVEFCGYSVPHPSEKKINIRIQTKDASATAVLKKGLEDLNALCDHVLSTFKKSVKQYKKATQGEEKMEVGSD